MELISKVSKGSRMDQVYIPKNRKGLNIGSYVVIKPLEKEKVREKPYLYDIKFIEPIKLEITDEIFDAIEKAADCENIIVTGSFLNKGFNFNDIDVLLISKDKINEKYIKEKIEDAIKIKIHLIVINNQTLIKGLETDPLYQMMISKCIAKKRLVYKIKPKFNYKILDLHLLKSKLLIINFDYLTGEEKYYLTRNMIAISLFLEHKKINKENVDREIEKTLNIKIENIKQNMFDQKEFLKKYKIIYKNVLNKIMNIQKQPVPCGERKGIKTY